MEGGAAVKVGVVWKEGQQGRWVWCGGRGQQGRWVWCGGRGSREGGCGVEGGTAVKVTNKQDSYARTDLFSGHLHISVL